MNPHSHPLPMNQPFHPPPYVPPPAAKAEQEQKRKPDSLTIKTITKPICFADTTTVGELFRIKLNTTCISLNTIMIKEEF